MQYCKGIFNVEDLFRLLQKKYSKDSYVGYFNVTECDVC